MLGCRGDGGGMLHQFPTPIPPRPPNRRDPSLAVCSPDDDVKVVVMGHLGSRAHGAWRYFRV
jgi:hypothetical protein